MSLRSDIFCTPTDAISFIAHLGSGNSFDSKNSHTEIQRCKMAFIIFTLVSLNPLVCSRTIHKIQDMLCSTSFEDFSKSPESIKLRRSSMASCRNCHFNANARKESNKTLGIHFQYNGRQVALFRYIPFSPDKMPPSSSEASH